MSSGVMYLDGELAIFNGATGVTFPLKLSKQRVGINPRQYADSVTRNTAEEVRAVIDTLGTFEFSSSTPRATDKFLRTVNGSVRGDINADNNEVGNIYKALLASRFEDKRLIPASPDASRYLKLGSFAIRATQNHSFNFFGGGSENGCRVKINIFEVNNGVSSSVSGDAYFTSSIRTATNTPKFFVKRNDTSGFYEFWMQSPTGLSGEEFTSSVIEMFSEGFTSDEDHFVFENTFNWNSPNPTGLVELTKKFVANTDDMVDYSEAIEEIEERLDTDIQNEALTAGTNVTLYNSNVSVKNGIVMISGRYKSGADSFANKIVLSIPATVSAPSHRVDIGASNAITQNSGGQQLYVASGSRDIKIENGGDDQVEYSFFFAYGIF